MVTGADLDAMDDEALAGMHAAGDQVIFARVRPEHKLRVVATLEKLGEVVAVTGDGANDAPALKRASVGVSMGQGGTDVARAASVMVLLDDSFASIAAAVELGRAVYQNIRRFLVYLFSHNLAELAPILAATFVGFPLVPLSALQVLSIDLGSDVLPALALGAERPEPGTMDRPPRPPAEHLFSWPVVRRFLFLGTIQSAGVVFAFFWRIHTAHLPFSAFTAANPTYREAVTMTQAGIVVSQFFNSFAVRTDRESVLRAGLLSNPPLIAAGCFGLAFMAAVSYVPALQAVFNTAPLTHVGLADARRLRRAAAGRGRGPQGMAPARGPAGPRQRERGPACRLTRDQEGSRDARGDRGLRPGGHGPGRATGRRRQQRQRRRHRPPGARAPARRVRRRVRRGQRPAAAGAGSGRHRAGRRAGRRHLQRQPQHRHRPHRPGRVPRPGRGRRLNDVEHVRGRHRTRARHGHLGAR